MKPFVIFRAPQTVRWHYQPRGRNRYRIHIWVKLPFRELPEVNEIITKKSHTISELMPIINANADELMDLLRNALYEHWANFLLSINDKTTDEEIDTFHDQFPESDYGFECYVWG